MSSLPPDEDTSVNNPHALPEGEESPPPGVKTMAIVRWALVAIMAVVAAAAVLSQMPGLWGGHDHGAETDIYYCPMHPQIQQPRPGECPICSMTLVKKPPGAVKPSATMQPATTGAVAAGKYHCPMHHQIVSDDPKARCPLCGMKLEPRPATAALADGGTPAASARPAPPARPVAGLVPVDLSPERVQLIGVRTEKATRTSLAGELRTVGAIEADERGLAQIATRFSGWVERLLVAETGQRVRKGQVLATIYSPEVLQAQEELLSAHRWSQGTPPAAAAPPHPGHLDTSQSLVADARHRLELLGIAAPEIEAILREGKPHRAIGIRSPVDGHTIGRHVLPGMAVQPGMALFEVADLSRLWVLADVYEGEAARVKVGQPVRFTVAAYPGQQWTGKVQLIYPRLESGSRTLRLRIQLATRKADTTRLRPGMFGDVFLDLPGTTGVVVPSEAVVDTGEQQYVFVTRDGGRFEPRSVKLGTRAGDRVEIKEGLAEGETVVTTANFLIDSESRLRAAIDKPPAGNPAPAPAPTSGGASR